MTPAIAIVGNDVDRGGWDMVVTDTPLQIAPQGQPNPRNGRNTDEAHPPIHPTKAAHDLQGDQANIYDVCVGAYVT